MRRSAPEAQRDYVGKYGLQRSDYGHKMHHRTPVRAHPHAHGIHVDHRLHRKRVPGNGRPRAVDQTFSLSPPPDDLARGGSVAAIADHLRVDRSPSTGHWTSTRQSIHPVHWRSQPRQREKSSQPPGLVTASSPRPQDGITAHLVTHRRRGATVIQHNKRNEGAS
jgi:hypothetical protein